MPVDKSTHSIHIAAKQTAAERREVERKQRKVITWWRTLPDSKRDPYYSITQLAKLIDVPAASLGPVLRELGWQREEVRIDGNPRAIWLPPGAASQKKPAGRPRLFPNPSTH